MRFHTTLKLGPNREQTREGFTLFKNVPIARTGEQIYGPDEVDVPAGPDGLVHIDRPAREVFRAETLDSCNGKSLVINHPIDDVDLDNWQSLTHGVMFNVRRGSGEISDHQVADILVTTRQAVQEIDSGTREVSLGYDADYFDLGEGRGEQRGITVNHIALVPSGRCGGSCAFRDHATEKAAIAAGHFAPIAAAEHAPTSCSCGGHSQKTADSPATIPPTPSQGAPNVNKTLRQRISDAFKTKDEDGLKKVLDEAEEDESEKAQKTKDEETEKRMKGIEDALAECVNGIKRLTATGGPEAQTAASGTRDAENKDADDKDKKTEDDDEAELGEEAPEGASDKARKSRDSSYLVESFETVKMNAEIISPGVQIPTFDRAADPKKTFKDCVCGLRRKSLQAGNGDTATAALIAQVRGRTTDSAEFGKMSCGQVRGLFNGVAALKKAQNNATFADGAHSIARQTADTKAAPIDKFVAASNARWGIGK